jgi:hypothetical protein
MTDRGKAPTVRLHDVSIEGTGDAAELLAAVERAVAGAVSQSTSTEAVRSAVSSSVSTSSSRSSRT